MFGFKKKNRPDNERLREIEIEFSEMAKIMDIDLESATPFHQLVVLTLVFGKINAKKEGTNIGGLNSKSINYLGLNDYSLADTIFVTSFYNLLMVAGRMEENKVNKFQYSYFMWINEGIHRITNLHSFDVTLLSENRTDVYFKAISEEDCNIEDKVKSEFENIIITDISGEYQDYDSNSPLPALGMSETINIKTQVGALFAGMPASFEGIHQIVANTF